MSARATVLVVDDEPYHRDLLVRRLRDRYEVLSAEDGPTALELAASHQPDLILLDVMMPDMDGYEVCRQLKANPATANVQVLFVTARGDPDDKITGLTAGGRDYVTKPFHADELLARVGAGVRAKQVMDALLAENRQLAVDSITDPLTGLRNRRYLDERMDQEIARARREGRPLGCLLVDVDHFKEINDTWGHEAGDQVLRDLASLLRTSFRTSDVLSRYGGDEFAALMPQAGFEDLERIAEKLRRKVERYPFTAGPGGPNVEVTVSVGAASLDGRENGALLRRADAALYRAKAHGRNKVAADADLSVAVA